METNLVAVIRAGRVLPLCPGDARQRQKRHDGEPGGLSRSLRETGTCSLLRERVRPTFCFGAPLNRLAGGREKSREGNFICSVASEEKKILPAGRYPDRTIPDLQR
jgi:hypothetical protein